MAITLYPNKINFLGTNYYFRTPVLRPLLKAAGVIPKIQFYKDIRAVYMMNKVISRGGVLGIFPEGRRSIDGTPSKILDGIAKLIKLYKVPVVSVVTNGTYLSRPRWSNFGRRGLIEVSAKKILDAEQIEKLSMEEIKEISCSSIYFNDYDWNRRKRICFKHKRVAENIEWILHECPGCGREKSMLSEGRRLYCKACGNSAIMDEYGFLSPENESSVVFEDTIKWFEWETSTMREHIKDKNFSINSRVKKLRTADMLTGPYHNAGSGYLVLNHEGLTFRGEKDSKLKELFFPVHVLSSVTSEFGVNFEITDGKDTYLFILEDGQDVIRFEMAISQLKK